MNASSRCTDCLSLKYNCSSYGKGGWIITNDSRGKPKESGAAAYRYTALDTGEGAGAEGFRALKAENGETAAADTGRNPDISTPAARDPLRTVPCDGAAKYTGRI